MRALGVIAMCAACGSSTAPAPRAPAPTPRAAAEPPAAEDSTRPAPGCTPPELAARRAELESIFEHMTDAKDGLGELRVELAKPCLVHVAAAVPVPAATTLDELRSWWGALDEAMELQVKRGLVHQVLPREIVPALQPSADLTPFLCTTGCERAKSYILRAEAAFDAREQAVEARLEPHIQGVLYNELPVQTCDGTWHDKPATFEAWVSCVAYKAPRNRRYAAGVALRAVERGWLVVRGRRGHYDWSNELRAYDLATGAAYVVRDTGYIIQTAGNVPQSEQYTGQVAPDQLREAAFVLLTQDAIVRVRTAPMYAVVPPAIPLQLSGAAFDADSWSRVTWSSDDQTTLAWTFADGALRRTGTVTWPEADDVVNNHITQLIAIAEAGLVRGCAPAKLPPLGELGLAKIPDDKPLEARLERLRGQACRK